MASRYFCFGFSSSLRAQQSFFFLGGLSAEGATATAAEPGGALIAMGEESLQHEIPEGKSPQRPVPFAEVVEVQGTLLLYYGKHGDMNAVSTRPTGRRGTKVNAPPFFPNEPPEGFRVAIGNFIILQEGPYIGTFARGQLV